VCGIVGFLSAKLEYSADSMRILAESMSATLAHRGPDSSDIWVDAAVGLALGHRRLAILDLNQTGDQPMVSNDSRYVISYNGEIYNFGSIRHELLSSGVRFRGTSDTEVLLEAISAWGLDKTLTIASGMFAFAVWDRRDQILSLARDRMGEKPLFYGWAGNVLLFGSELKALHAHPKFSPSLDDDAIALYLRYGYIPGPYTPFRGMRKLVPGTVMSFRADRVGLLPDPEPFWSLESIVEKVRQEPPPNENEVVPQLEELLTQSVKSQMVADVPLGAFLSGGIDSSTVVALMQTQSDRPVKTFSIGFDEQGFDEAPYAKQVARHIGTDHTELYVTPKEAQDVVPKLSEMYDEPFGDSSQIPTNLVSVLARRDVTVALSGDGGDELFGGYPRYERLSKTWQTVRHIPAPVRNLTAHGLMAVPASWWGAARRGAAFVLPKRAAAGLPSPRAAETLAEILDSTLPHSAYHLLVSHWRRPAELVLGSSEPTVPITAADGLNFGEDVTSWAMFVDALQYLPDDILTKVDRASMAESLEVRVPMLDPSVVEFAWSLAPSLRNRDGRPKWPLRQVLYRHVPSDLVDRPKMGFGVPIHEWLRGPLREWAESLLQAKVLSVGGLLDPEPIKRAWSEHLAGTRDNSYPLWDVLQLMAWRQRWRV